MVAPESVAAARTASSGTEVVQVTRFRTPSGARSTVLRSWSAGISLRFVRACRTKSRPVRAGHGRRGPGLGLFRALQAELADSPAERRAAGERGWHGPLGLPLVAEDEVGNGVALPRHVELRVFAGADGEHVLVEDDDGPDATRRVARTPLRVDSAARTLTVGPAEGYLDVLPPRRTWTVVPVGVAVSAPVHAISFALT